MKVGDIKIEAIKLMFTNYAYDMSIDDLQRMISDENYGSYIVNMNGSIARAIDRIENACVVPVKRRTIKANEITPGAVFDRFDTSKIPDLFQIDRLTAEYPDGDYDGNAEYEEEGEILLIRHDGAVSHTLLYYPKIKTVDENVLDSDEFWIPDNIARIIPYFVKGDLYQEEEPKLAADARNIFEASLDDLRKQPVNKQQKQRSNRSQT